MSTVSDRVDRYIAATGQTGKDAEETRANALAVTDPTTAAAIARHQDRTIAEKSDDWLQSYYTSAGLGKVDEGGRDYWEKDLAGGQTKDQIRDNIMRHKKAEVEKRPVRDAIADKLDWEIDWDTPSGHVSTNDEYVRPWDVEGWGTDDVVITPPRNPGNYVPPSKPAIQPGQRDWVYMPTEREQWRIEDENKRRQAAAVGTDWRETRLPREARIQEEDVYIPTDKERNRENRRPSLRDTLMSDIRSTGGLSSDRDRIALLTGGDTYDSEPSRDRERYDLLTGGDLSSDRERIALLTGNSEPSRDRERYDLLTGSGLSSDRDRMAMLTGRY